MKILKPTSRQLIISAIASLIVSASMPAIPAFAATPQFASGLVRLNRLHKNSVTGGTVCVKTPASGVGGETYVDIGFPVQATVTTTNFTLNATTTNWTVTTHSANGTTTFADPDALDAPNGTTSLYYTSGAADWPGVTSIAAHAHSVDATNKIVRFDSTALAANKVYCFDFGAALTLPDTAGFDESTPGYIATYDNTGTAGTPGSGNVIMRTNWATQISDDTGGATPLSKDQIVVNAIVPPLFQFDLSATTDSIPAAGNLNYQVVNTSGGVNATVHTNAKNGWVIWSKSANNTNGLISASAGGVAANANIPSVPWNTGAPTDLDSNATSPNFPTAPLYGMSVSQASAGGHCTIAVAPEYNTGTLDGTPAAHDQYAGAMTANFQQIASCPGGTSNGGAISIKERAAITVDVPAATDYTDTLTVVGAGNF
jgi:hypothetical protein